MTTTKHRLTDKQVVDIFIKIILEKRSELKMTPRKCSAVSLMDAASTCSIGTVGNTVTDLLTLQEQGDKRDLVDFLDKHMSKILAFGFIVGIILVGLYAITKIFGGSV